MTEQRQVVMRNERTGADYRHLLAYVDGDGALHVDGQDLGPGTAMVSGDGEYEWFSTVAAEHVPQLVALLGGTLGQDVLELIETRFTGRASYEFERVLRESDIPVQRAVWSG